MKENYHKIYKFILNELKDKGKVPTLQEIGNEFSFSRENARQILTRMEKKGYLMPIKSHRRRYYPKIVPDIL